MLTRFLAGTAGGFLLAMGQLLTDSPDRMFHAVVVFLLSIITANSWRSE